MISTMVDVFDNPLVADAIGEQVVYEPLDVLFINWIYIF